MLNWIIGIVIVILLGFVVDWVFKLIVTVIRRLATEKCSVCKRTMGKHGVGVRIHEKGHPICFDCDQAEFPISDGN